MNERSLRLTNVRRTPSSKNLRPKDAATLIILDRKGKTNRVLMGKRHPDHKFLPGKFVFPGGRVAPGDSRIKPWDELSELETQKLLIDMKGRPSPSRARALALAAIRETYEETGILVGKKDHTKIPATRSRIWQSFFSEGVIPTLRSLTFVARAITPPRRTRRYDTRFFCVPQDEIATRTDSLDGELLDPQWISINEAMSLDVPMITRVVLEELAERLSSNNRIKKSKPVPYYYMENGVFKRQLINEISPS